MFHVKHFGAIACLRHSGVRQSNDVPRSSTDRPARWRSLGEGLRMPSSSAAPTFLLYGGDGGIRTLDRALPPYNGLANRRLQPLGHVSVHGERRTLDAFPYAWRGMPEHRRDGKTPAAGGASWRHGHGAL